jgi:predicted DNA-binding protein YlxM (UPF0122 family)
VTENMETLKKLHTFAVLYDLYEELLPPRQRQVLRLKLNEDMSLSEMAEELGTSRQACEDAYKRGRRALGAYERKIGLMFLQESQRKRAECLKRLLCSMTDDNWRETRDEVLSLIRIEKEAASTDGI